MNPIYVITDVEVDGPTPGENSMLSFASVAIDDKGDEIDDFQAVLESLEEAKPDAVTMAWFRSQPDALTAATKNPKPAHEVMSYYVNWIKTLPGDPVFVAHPLALDGAWIDFYLRRFAGFRIFKGPWPGERLFYTSGLCLQSYASGKLNWPLWQCTLDQYKPEWLGHLNSTHKAIDDARAGAKLLTNLMLL